MKSNVYINFINMFSYIIFIICITKIYSISYINPVAFPIYDNKLLIIHKYGVDVCDQELNLLKESIIFETTEEQISIDNLSKITITKFDDEMYIISIINDKFYIFDKKGNCLIEKSKVNTYGSQNPNSYFLIPIITIFNGENNYYFYYGFISEKNFLYIFYTWYNNKLNFIDEVTAPLCQYEDYDVQKSGISCYIMKYGEKQIFTCFFVVLNNNKKVFRVKFYKRDGGTLVKNNIIASRDFEISNIKYFKTNINSSQDKVLICSILLDNSNFCFGYDINKNEFTTIFNCNGNFCKDKFYSLNVDYFIQNEKFIFSCSSNYGSVTLCIFNNDFEYEQKIFSSDQCENIGGYSNIYLNDKNYILSNEICSGIAKSPKDNQDITNENGEEEVYEEEEKEKDINNAKNEEEEKNNKNEEEKEKDINKTEKEEEDKNNRNEEEKEKDINKTEKEKEDKNNKNEEEKEKEKGQNNYNCSIKECKICNSESEKKNLCVECNKLNGYYPLNTSFLSENDLIDSKYLKCLNEETKPSFYFLNKITKYFEKCYETCATCEYGGNERNNNCSSCENGFIPQPEINNTKNCVINCPFYYYVFYGRYECTYSFQCPNNSNFLVKTKRKCINNCQKDNNYKYQYNGECLESCPTNTTGENDDYICKDINRDICTLAKREINISDDNLLINDVDVMAKTYTNEYDYTDNHISLFNEKNYKITIYKNKECISNLKLETSEIDFRKCYENVKNKYNIDDNLIMAIIDKKIEGQDYPKIISFSMYNPEKGEKLIINDVCENELVTVEENIIKKLNNKYNYELIKYMLQQNIDIFNLSGEFYTDICFHFESPFDKDITLKDRFLLFFPNITLCENGCSMKGVKLDTMRSICQCKFNNGNYR